MARLAPVLASLALHVAFVGLAAIVVPRASARVADAIPVRLVAIEPPPRVVEATPAPPAPPRRITLPKPIVTPAPKVEPRPEPPREPESAPAPVRDPRPAPVPTRVSEPVAPAAAPPATAPPAAAAASGSASAPATTGQSTDSGVSWIDSGAAGRSSAIVASIPPDGAVTREARPTGGYQVRPSYPSSAKRLGIQGTTLLRVHVLADGRVGDIDVEQSAGHPDLDQAATVAVRRWRFEPARRGEQAVPMWVRLPVEFRLK